MEKSGPQGPIGPQGPQGPSGNDGTSVTILGSYPTFEDLNREQPVGNIGDAYLVGSDLYVWSNTDGAWKDVGDIKGPQGEQGIQGIPGERGATGPTGPAGPELLRAAYIVTFNDGTASGGIAIPENERLPLDRKELDVSNLVTLDSSNETIKFNVAGYYKITINIYGYIKLINSQFDPTTDFISIGFKQIGTDNIYIGASKWCYDENVEQLTAQGILSVNNPANIYELVNVGKKSICLNSPDLKNINTNSYFVNPLVNIVIEYLGRQGA